MDHINVQKLKRPLTCMQQRDKVLLDLAANAGPAEGEERSLAHFLKNY